MCAHCTVVKRFGRCVCVCVFRVKVFSLFSAIWKTEKNQRFSRQLHKIKFEPFASPHSPIVSSRLKKAVAGPPKKSIHTFNHQLSNNYLDEEIRCIFFRPVLAVCVVCNANFVVGVVVVAYWTWNEIQWIPQKYDFLARNKTNATHTHIYLTGGHTRICDAMWCDEKYKSQWANNLALALVIHKLPEDTHKHILTEMQFTCCAAVLDRFVSP